MKISWPLEQLTIHFKKGIDIVSNYTDPSSNFKLVPPSEFHIVSKRNMKIWDMILNRLGLPDHLHEAVRAIFVSGNWDQVDGMEEITIKRMAKNITSNEDDLQRIYNRLKKNIPRFFEWQDNQPFEIIQREIISDRAQKYRTKAKYRFLLYDLVVQLFSLAKEETLWAVRRAVDVGLENYPKVDKPPRKPKRKKIKSLARAYIRNANEIIDLTGSIDLAAVEIEEENLGGATIFDLADKLLILKSL